MEFTPRTTAPSNSDLHWIKRGYGFHGYNRCIIINRTTGSVLPNCTGYAWGRFLEENNLTDCKLSRGNGEVWYSNTSDGYARGQTPKLGAVICWHSTRSGGHVAIVEEIKSNGDIVCSNSAYNGRRFFLRTLKAPKYYFGSAYTFQGFIYPPNEFTPPTPPEPPTPSKKKRTKFPWVLYAKKLRNNR